MAAPHRFATAALMLSVTLCFSYQPAVSVNAHQPAAQVAASRLRAAVCVVGQVGRLEVKSKMANLLQPNRHIAAMDFFLVLRPGIPRYTNLAPPTPCTVAPHSIEEAARQMSAHGAAVHTVARLGDQFPQVDPSIWPGYQASKTLSTEQRMGNHLDQMRNWRECADAIERAEQEQGARYHVVLRLRDNALVLHPFDLERLLRNITGAGDEDGQQRSAWSPEKASSSPVIVKSCSAWSGYPDKAMVIPRKYMHSALRGPAKHFQSAADLGEERMKVFNFETYLKHVLDHRHRTPVVMQQDPALLPITDGRCESGVDFCYVNARKDCRPFEVTGVDAQECKMKYISNNVPLKKAPPSHQEQPQDARSRNTQSYQAPLPSRPSEALQDRQEERRREAAAAQQKHDDMAANPSAGNAPRNQPNEGFATVLGPEHRHEIPEGEPPVPQKAANASSENAPRDHTSKQATVMPMRVLNSKQTVSIRLRACSKGLQSKQPTHYRWNTSMYLLTALVFNSAAFAFFIFRFEKLHATRLAVADRIAKF